MALISTEGTKAHYKRQFSGFFILISQSKYKKLGTLIQWHTVDSLLAYRGLMENGVCQLFLNFAYWVSAFWIRWPDYIVFGGEWHWPSRSNLTSKSKFTPFWACLHDNSSPVQARATKFGQELLNTLIKIPVVLGVDWAWHVKFNLFSKSCLFASLLRLWNICETCKKRMKRSLFHILNGYAHICSPTETCHGPWNSRVVSLVWPLLASQFSTRRLAMDFCMLL